MVSQIGKWRVQPTFEGNYPLSRQLGFHHSCKFTTLRVFPQKMRVAHSCTQGSKECKMGTATNASHYFLCVCVPQTLFEHLQILRENRWNWKGHQYELSGKEVFQQSGIQPFHLGKAMWWLGTSLHSSQGLLATGLLSVQCSGFSLPNRKKLNSSSEKKQKEHNHPNHHMSRDQDKDWCKENKKKSNIGIIMCVYIKVYVQCAMKYTYFICMYVNITIYIYIQS